MTSGYIYQKFGNNGKLVINREPVQDIEVTKKWADEHDGVDSVTVNLYGKGTAVNGDTTTEGIWLIDTVELNEANNWTYKWEDLPLTETDGDTEYTYDNLYIAEAAMDSFAPKYADSSGNELSTDALTINSAVDESDADSEEESEEGNNVAEEVNAVIADGGSVVITNNKTYTLPESGGIGTHVFTLSAVLLLTAAGFMYIYSKRKDKRIRQEAM
jgi:LPXTG-motif cell wall-anchored protein